MRNLLPSPTLLTFLLLITSTLVAHVCYVTTLVIASNNHPSLTNFKQANPNITFSVNTDLTANSDLTFRTIQSLFSRQDSSIDVFQIDNIWFGDLAEHFVDLNQYLSEEEKSRFYQVLIKNLTVKQKLLGLPWWYTGGLMFYRKDLLLKYGYSEPPKTWDELEIMAKVIQDGERAAGVPDFWGWAWNSYPNEGLTCLALEMFGSVNAGQIIEIDDQEKLKITIDNPHSKAMIDRAKGWIGTISPYTTVQSKERDLEGSWLLGKIAFSRNWPGLIGTTYNTPSMKDKFEVASLPGITPGSGKATLGGWSLAVSKYSKNIGKAIKLVKFLTSPSELKNSSLTFTRLPPKEEVLSDPELCNNDRTKFMCSLKLNIVPRPAKITSPNYNTASQIIYVGLNAAISGKMDTSVALKHISRDLLDLFHLGSTSTVTYRGRNWIWFGTCLSVLIVIIFVSAVLYFVVPIASKNRGNGKIHNKTKLSEQIVSMDGSSSPYLNNGQKLSFQVRPSIRSIIILLFVILIVITSLSVWLLSWSNGRDSAQILGKQLRRNILQRIKESTENSILTAQALGKGSLTIDYAKSVIATFVPTVFATENTRIAVIDLANGIVIATTGVKTTRGRPLSESEDFVTKEASKYLLKRFGSYGQIEFKQGDQHSFKNGAEKIFIDGVSVIDPTGIAWAILIMIPEYDIMGRIHRGTLITLIVSIVVIMLSVGFSLIFSYIITQPLSSLVNQMERVTEMDLNSAGKISYSLFYEVFSIQLVFQRMVEMMREYKSYMPSSLFVEGGEEEEDRHSIDTNKFLGSVSDMTPSSVMRPLETGTSKSSQSSKKEVKHLGNKATRVDLIPKKFTVVIINIENFNFLLKILSVADVILIHSDYIENITKVIAHHRGSYDRFVADKIVGTFNTAVSCNTHAENACRCALACLERVNKLQKTWTKLGFPLIKIRIGIASGSGYCGNMGSSSVRAYSVLGPTVNVASSLEQMNKVFKTKILVEDNVVEAVQSKIVARTVDVVHMVKLDQPNSLTRVYELIQMKDIKGDEWMYELQESERYNQVFHNYEQGFQAYIQQEYEKCISFMRRQLQETPDDYQTKRVIELVEKYLTMPNRSFVIREIS